MQNFFEVLRRIALCAGILMLMLSLCINDESLSLFQALRAFLVLFLGGAFLVSIALFGRCDEDEEEAKVEAEYDKYEV